jgi:hypothetical protein
MRGSPAARLQVLSIRIPPRASMSVSSVVCCQVGVSASGWSPVQSSPIECGVSECDREASIRTPWPTRGCCAIGENKSFLQNQQLLYTTLQGTTRKITSILQLLTMHTSNLHLFGYCHWICFISYDEYFLLYITQNSTNDLLRIAKQVKISKATD